MTLAVWPTAGTMGTVAMMRAVPWRLPTHFKLNNPIRRTTFIIFQKGVTVVCAFLTVFLFKLQGIN